MLVCDIQMDIQAFLKSEYQKLEDYNDDLKLQRDVLFNIIKTKKNNQLCDYHRSLYLDIKRFIKADIELRAEADYGYDYTDFDKIKQCIEYVPIQKQKSLYAYMSNQCRIKGYDSSEWDLCKDDCERRIAWKDREYIKCFLKWSAHSIQRLLCIYLALMLLLGVMMCPAPFNWMNIFHVEMYLFCDDSFWNHVLNTFSFFCMSDDFGPKIVPVNMQGIIVYALFCFTNFVLIGNYLTRKLLEKFYIYD